MTIMATVKSANQPPPAITAGDNAMGIGTNTDGHSNDSINQRDCQGNGNRNGNTNRNLNILTLGGCVFKRPID